MGESNSYFSSIPYKIGPMKKALSHLRMSSPNMAALIERVGPCKLKVDKTQDLFLTLAEAIVYQQLHGKAAATIFGRVCDLFPRSGQYFTPSNILRASEEKLRSAGLSKNKALALRDLATKVSKKNLPTIEELKYLDDEEIIKQLITVRGIGRWTVEMLLIFRLGRKDVLPVDDFGVRKGCMLAYGLAEMPTPKELQAIGEPWAPYRSIASWYMWRATELY